MCKSFIRWTPAVFFAILLSRQAVVVDAGCYQRRLCCPGRNLTCFAFDDDLDNVRYEAEFPSVYVDKKPIGRLVSPDVIELDRSGDELINELGSDSREFLTGDSVIAYQFINIPLPSSPKPKLRTLIFGEAFYPNEKSLVEHERYSGTHRLIRYSLLNQHLPLTLGDYVEVASTGAIVRRSTNKLRHAARRKVQRQQHQPRLRSRSAQRKRCFCDEACIALGDCCSDYRHFCSIVDCQVSEWSEWSPCLPNNASSSSPHTPCCGPGTQTRLRRVLRERQYGGANCPHLQETVYCFKQCADDDTTVALLVDYRHSETRAQARRDNIYWDLPEVVEKRRHLTYYCVHYAIGWVNRNCVDKKITQFLYTGNTICAECQPEAQMHRKTSRCASDLNDGDRGFWKLIGPKSCNGIWTRKFRTDNCRCQNQFPKDTAYLLV